LKIFFKRGKKEAQKSGEPTLSVAPSKKEGEKGETTSAARRGCFSREGLYRGKKKKSGRYGDRTTPRAFGGGEERRGAPSRFTEKRRKPGKKEQRCQELLTPDPPVLLARRR